MSRSAEALGNCRLRQRAGLSTGEIAYDLYGTGPPLVLVHGTPSWSYLWRTVVPTLAQESTVYIFDLLGYGDSARADGQDISIAALALVLAEPVLTIWGEQDAWLDVKNAKRLAQTIPAAEVRLIPEAGHFVMEDAPGPVSQALAQFFAPDDLGAPR